MSSSAEVADLFVSCVQALSRALTSIAKPESMTDALLRHIFSGLHRFLLRRSTVV